MTSLEERVQRLEDVEAIKVLKAEYCAYCDDHYDPDGIASLFVEHGVWDGGFMAGSRATRPFVNILRASVRSWGLPSIT